MSQDQRNLTRRSVLSKIGLATAAAGGAAAVLAAQGPFEAAASGPTIVVKHVHLPGLSKYDPKNARKEARAAERLFEQTLTPEQRTLYINAVDAMTMYHCYQQDAFITALARHFPLLAPAIRCVAQHVMELPTNDMTTCCECDWPEDQH